MHAAYMARIMCVYNYKTNTVGGDLFQFVNSSSANEGDWQLSPHFPFYWWGFLITHTDNSVCVDVVSGCAVLQLHWDN